ncbi:hypothetical protein P59_072 [Bacillus phage P59]|jgi:hypothetical protein|nr:hypothetical protein P59_072 [Bacillus phage P59]
MSSFSQDEKWMEAKRAVGHLNWLEVISYYRSIDGKNVEVYSVRDGEQRLIVDLIDDDTVLLLDKDGFAREDTYENVLSSRKIFKYSESKSQIEWK